MPDSGAGDDPSEPSTVIPHLKARMESLSDLVFGLALSIGSLVLVGKAVEDGEALGFNIALFGFGFLIIVLAWLGYTRTMAVLPIEVPMALVANLALLFLVAVEPYLFYVLWSAATPGLVDSATVAYALDIGGLSLAQAALAYLVVRGKKPGAEFKHPIPALSLARFRRVATLNSVLGIVWIISALPVFWVNTPIGPLRYYVWAASFSVSLVTRSSGRSYPLVALIRRPNVA